VFDPQVLAKLGSLELIANTVVDGFLSGKHRSTHKGGCTDFAGYRPYARGDDIRQLDWRHFARSDRYYVRQFDDETNLQALLIADASGSMDFGLSTVTKWRYAQMAIASAAHLLLRQRDGVGLAIVGKSPLNYVRPLPSAAQLPRMLNMLSAANPSGESDLPSALTALQGRLKRRGMVILFSDGFCEVASLKQALEQFRLRGHDVIVCQILAPEELTFPFRRDAMFQDLESPGRLRINPNAIRRQYQQEFQAFMEELQASMVEINVDLMTMTTADHLGEILAYYLHRRASMKTLGHARART
jgi:uncharacterized protein (DUF58 family)